MIVQSLGWVIGQPTCWEFYDQIHDFCKATIGDERQQTEVSNLTILYMMASLFDYDICTGMTDMQIAAAAYKLAVKQVVPLKEKEISKKMNEIC